MSNFIQTAESRETSIELMEAIYQVAGNDDAHAEFIWEEGPTSGELVAIIEVVTKNGMHETTDFVWGSMGENWANELDQ